jgi:CRP-like cAMP-binding protein
MPDNHLISDLGRTIRQRLLANCDEVELCIGDILWVPRKRIRHVYFPVDSVISQLVPVDVRENLEFAAIGNEGMLGTPLALGMDSSSMQAVVQDSGTALRMSAAIFRRELHELPAFRQKINRYIYVLQEQLAQSAVCISHHTLDLRLARLLLMTHDRVVGSSTFRMTHKVLAQMLGVRRVGVTNAAGKLKKLGLLSYNRGNISILDRAGLEKASCICYQTSKDIYDRAVG